MLFLLYFFFSFSVLFLELLSSRILDLLDLIIFISFLSYSVVLSEILLNHFIAFFYFEK